MYHTGFCSRIKNKLCVVSFVLWERSNPFPYMNICQYTTTTIRYGNKRFIYRYPYLPYRSTGQSSLYTSGKVLEMFSFYALVFFVKLSPPLRSPDGESLLVYHVLVSHSLALYSNKWIERPKQQSISYSILLIFPLSFFSYAAVTNVIYVMYLQLNMQMSGLESFRNVKNVDCKIQSITSQVG